MRYKDIDSQKRFQRAWDAMMAQKPEEKPAPVTPEQEDDTWILMGMLVTGFLAGIAVCVLAWTVKCNL